MTSQSDGRVWVAAAAGVVALAVVARIHDAFAFPPLNGFDAPGHALSVFALYEGRLPDLHSWSGFHPPLYYALGAALWHVLPASIPVHAALRLLSAAAGFGAVAIIWRALRHFVPLADASVVAAAVACAPVMAIAGSMIGNETTCALFATAALASLAAGAPDRVPAWREALVAMLFAVLAALSKSTGLAVVAVVGVATLWRARPAPGRALRLALAQGALVLALAGPWYGSLMVRSGTPLAVITGGALSRELGNEMAVQPPGERHLRDYLLLPPGTFLAPFKDAPDMVRSVPGMLYASTWADAHGQFLPVEVRQVVVGAALGALLGLLPTVLALLGAWRIARRPRAFAGAGPALAYGVLLLVAFLVQTWVVPVYSAVKASYLLSALLPAALLLAAGLAGAAPGRRGVLRAALLGIALYQTGLTWYGWWT